MAKVDIYTKILGLKDIHRIIDEFRNTLVDTNRSYNYFVDWSKVKQHTEKYNVEINILNSLVGEGNIEKKLAELLSRYPEVLPVLPLIIAVRELEMKILEGEKKEINDVKQFNFEKKKNLSKEEISKIIHFCRKTGIISLFKDFRLKHLRDYLLGIEVGMDTNARKNRSGIAMELAVKPILENLKNEISSLEIIFQKKFKYIEKNYNINIPPHLSNRKFDFVIKKKNLLINVEVNYYSGQGSKPQEIVDSYINRKNELSSSNWEFIWITDGPGWKGGINQMYKAFEEMDYVLNLNFIKRGILSEILKFLITNH